MSSQGQGLPGQNAGGIGNPNLNYSMPYVSGAPSAGTPGGGFGSLPPSTWNNRQDMSVGGTDPQANMRYAGENLPGSPFWLQRQAAGYYGAPFISSGGVQDFGRWNWLNASAPQGQQAQPGAPAMNQPTSSTQLGGQTQAGVGMVDPNALPSSLQALAAGTPQPAFTPPTPMAGATGQSAMAGGGGGRGGYTTPATAQPGQMPAGVFGPDPRVKAGANDPIMTNAFNAFAPAAIGAQPRVGDPFWDSVAGAARANNPGAQLPYWLTGGR